jgi:hypothetical protein
MAARTPLNINHAYQKAVSYSQYSTYSQCNYRWYLNYIKKESAFSHSIHTVYGTSMHEVMQTYLETMYEKSIKEADEMDLPKMLEERLIENYKTAKEDNKGEHFSTKEQIKEFVDDGCATLEWFKKNRGRYFSKKYTKLVGIEIPILLPVLEDNPNILLNGYIDFILYDEQDNKYTIYDIKTSTKGWQDKEKKDQIKINQLLLYKRFYAKAMNVPEENVDVKFFIVKRKVFSNPDFPIHRVQEFVPANGKKKVEGAYQDLSKFIRECFDSNAKYNTDRVYEKNLDACKWCQYKDRPDLCDRKK